jgi:prepilin-type N-terminal cleavage/methylation domain-containing protein
MRALQLNSHSRRISPRAAFTLLEVVIALIIVGMAAVGTLSAFAAELRTAETSRSALEAAALAQGRIAMLEVMPAELLLALPDTSRSGHFELPFEQYHWVALVTQVVNEADLFEATVRVTWPDGNYAISTRMYRPVALARPW